MKLKKIQKPFSQLFSKQKFLEVNFNKKHNKLKNNDNRKNSNDEML